MSSKNKRNTGIFFATLGLASLALPAPPAFAGDQNDANCEILFCMASGFMVPECRPAYKRMIKNITPWPVRPPFGICSFTNMSGTTEDLDTTGSDYAYLDKLRVLWWQYRQTKDKDGNTFYTYALKSCDRDNAICETLLSAYEAPSMPTGPVEADGYSIEFPHTIDGMSRFSGTAKYVSMVHADYEGNITLTEWNSY